LTLKNPRRAALVIGNGTYPSPAQLKNAVNDADDVAKRLSANGFDVSKLVDASNKDMDRALKDFRQKLTGHEIGLFFFAGHGVQIEGENYLIAIDTDLSDETDAKHSSLALNRIVESMEKTDTTSNIIVLDACRDNPFERAWRSGALRGLAPQYAPRGTLIAYATSPGQTASDGSGRNGAYTAALLEHIDTPDVSVERMFKRVRNTLSAATHGKQISWEHTSLAQELYLCLPINALVDEYSANALSDSLFILDATVPAHRVIHELKSSNWYRQNPAVKSLTPELVEGAGSDTLFVIGRNIYQAASGSANDALIFLRQFPERTLGYDQQRRRAILDGILFEIFFNRQGELRDAVKGGASLFNDAFDLQAYSELSESFDFIANCLSPHAERFYSVPGKNVSKSVDVILAKEGEDTRVKAVHIDGGNVLKPGADPWDLSEGAEPVYHVLSQKRFEDHLSEETALPSRLTKIAYSGAELPKAGVSFPMNYTTSKGAV
jgi:hypothetical protein